MSNLYNPGRVWVFLVVLMGGLATSAAQRYQADLSGPWQFQRVTELNYPPPANWESMTVPGYLSGAPYERAWFRRSFSLPTLTAQERVKLQFGGVKYNSTVRINGQVVGGCFNGYNPLEIDITDASRSGCG